MLISPIALLAGLAANPQPSGPRSFAVIEATCSGGVAGRRRAVRLGPDGQLSRSEGWQGSFVAAGRMTPAQAKSFSRRLDHVAFDSLRSLPRGRTVYDGISCTLRREGQEAHVVQFAAGAVAPPAVDAARYREARAVLSAILNAADQMKLKP